MVIETNITKMLGIKHPIIAAPMGPFFTTELTIAVSEAGGLGVLSHTGLLSEFQARRFPTEIMKENMLKVPNLTLFHEEPPIKNLIKKDLMNNSSTTDATITAPIILKISKNTRANPEKRERLNSEVDL